MLSKDFLDGLKKVELDTLKKEAEKRRAILQEKPDSDWAREELKAYDKEIAIRNSKEDD